MVYLYDSFILRSFLFLFIHNVALLREFVAIATGVRVEFFVFKGNADLRISLYVLIYIKIIS